MALNLGDVNFGIGADTRALEKAHRALRQFAHTVDSTVARTDQLEASSVGAAVRQERAIRRATLQMENMSAAIRRVGADASLIDQVARATDHLRNTMRAGQLSALDFARAQDRFALSMGNVRRQLADFKSNQAGQRFGRMSELLKDLTSASVLAVGPLSGLGARIAALGAITSRSTLSLAAFLAGMSGAVVATVGLVAASLKAEKQMEIIDARMRAASGSATLAGQEFEFVAHATDRLAIGLVATAKEYSSFRAAAQFSNLELGEQQEVFLGVAEAAAALRLTNDQVAGAFKALTQIMSKGTVQAEELRGQLGERIPGAFALAARAMGVTEKKLGDMLKAGEVTAEEFLPRFAKELRRAFGVDAQLNVQTFAGAVNRLSNQWFLYSEATDEALGISRTVTKLINALADSFEFLRLHINDVVDISRAATGAMLGMVTPEILRGLSLVATGVRFLYTQVVALNVATLANPFTALSGVLIRVGAAVAGAAVAYLAFGQNVDKAHENTAELLTSTKALTEAYGNQRRTLQQTVDAHKELIDVHMSDLRVQVRMLEAEVRRLQKQEEELAAVTGGGTTSPEVDILIGMDPGKLKKAQDQLAQVRKDLADLAQQHKELNEIVGAGAGNAPEAIDGLAASYAQLAQMVRDGTMSQEMYNLIVSGITGELKKAQEQEKLFAEHIREVVSQWIPAEIDGMDALAGAHDARKKTLEEEAEALRRVQEAASYWLAVEATGLDFLAVGHAERMKQLKKEQEEASQGAQRFADIVSSGFAQGIFAGDKFEDILRNITERLAEAILQQYVFNQLVAAMGKPGLQGALPTPVQPRAVGGPAHKGQPYLVGENGPELFIPATSGMVSPNAGGTTIVINAPGATMETVAALERVGRDIERRAVNKTLTTLADQRSRGGRLS